VTTLKFEDQKLPDLDDYARLAEQFIPGRQAIFAAGFERLTPIFRGLAIKGWLAFA
jgi:hypothetical protein